MKDTKKTTVTEAETTTVTESTETMSPALVSTTDLTAEFKTVEVGTGATIRTTTTTDDVTLFNAINGSAEKVDDYLGQEVTVTDIVVSSADVLKDINDPDPDNGEKENKPVVHFFTSDGVHISSISNGIARATKNLLSVGFNPTKDSPIVIRFKEVKTKRGTAHSFDLVSR